MLRLEERVKHLVALSQELPQLLAPLQLILLLSTDEID